MSSLSPLENRDFFPAAARQVNGVPLQLISSASQDYGKIEAAHPFSCPASF